ncbi:MAG: hydrogenase expression/formation protein HypE [Candidatus Hydromicrobium americanum]|nr:MAG: hydrogenase expression/formation protein HypE [Candidatus Hydromicrobium americanum]
MKISLAHGSGGKLTHNLIKELFLTNFLNPLLKPLTDSAIINLIPQTLVSDYQMTDKVCGNQETVGTKGTKIAFTTDSYTVTPIFFPGGDIGKLAVCGTVNDLSVMGAKPLYLSCSYVIEEGLDYETLVKITKSVSETAKNSGVQIATGDTKVVEKGKGDKIFINTSGIGICEYEFKEIQIGDKILLNGGIGEHEIAILTARESLGLETEIKSDCASLWNLISQVLKSSREVKFMRDPTRGGIATVLNEVTENKDFGILLYEEKIPVKEEVKGVCALLGFDPLYLANEGKVIIVVASEDADKLVNVLRGHSLGKDAQVIGEVVKTPAGKVYLKTKVGGTRIVDMLIGEQLPRIC